MNHIVIGMGEVGKAVHEVLSSCKEYNVGFRDVQDAKIPFGKIHAAHVAIPYSESFVNTVKKYIGLYRPSLVIVHSTVPVGTCDANYWVHSPVRGVHPRLAEGIRTFIKYFGGIRSDEASDIFSAIGIKTVALPHAKECEAAKLWDTTQYGWQIVLNKAIFRWCHVNKVDFEFVYKEFNRSYNEGYQQLGRPNVVRPYLNFMPGQIGGHCVIPNLPLLGDNEITEFVDSYNQSLSSEMPELVRESNGN